MLEQISKRFALARFAAPLLNTPDFQGVFGGADRSTLPLDNQGLLRAVETVALPGTKLELIEQSSEEIFKVKTQDYPSAPLYVDKRFLIFADSNVPERPLIWPSADLILHRMKSLIGSMYVWGGNWPSIPRMLQLYPPAKALDEKSLKTWTFQGVDCSGLLYWATDGCAPRNTSELISFGKSLEIEGMTAQEVQKLIRPLDLIVWKGHVIIVLNSEETIESRAGFGVVTTNFLTRFDEILHSHKRKPASSWQSETQASTFVINRWLPHLQV